MNISSGSIETLKWIALIAMAADHINKYLYAASVPGLFELGRIALPIFVFVLAYNLSMPGAIAAGRFKRLAVNLGLFAAVSSVPFIMLGGLLHGWWPLNVLFTLLSITAVIYFIELAGGINYVIAAVLFIVAGSMVEFWWPAIALGVCVWLYLKTSFWIYAVLACGCCASLVLVNGNYWAIASIPIIMLLSYVRVPAPRIRWFFYSFYPIHLTALVLIRAHLEKSGYLFL